MTLMRRHYSIAEPKLILTPSLRSPRFPSLDRVMPPPLSISPFSDAKGTQHVVHSLGLGRVRGKRRDDLREGPESGRGQRRVNETGDRTDEGETSGQDRISRWRKLCRWLCSCTIHSPDRGADLFSRPSPLEPRTTTALAIRSDLLMQHAKGSDSSTLLCSPICA